MAAADPYALTIQQAAHDAVRALPTSAPDSPAGSAALREVTAWLVHEHGLAGVLDLAEELAVDLAEAVDAIAAAEQRDGLEVADRWFHDQPAPDVPGPTATLGFRTPTGVAAGAAPRRAGRRPGLAPTPSRPARAPATSGPRAGRSVSPSAPPIWAGPAIRAVSVTPGLMVQA